MQPTGPEEAMHRTNQVTCIFTQSCRDSVCAKISIACITVEKSRSSWVAVVVLRAGGDEDDFVGVCLSCIGYRAWKGLEFLVFVLELGRGLSCHVMLTKS